LCSTPVPSFHRQLFRIGLANITVGSSAKELRMVGMARGWIVGPEEFMPDIVAVSLANVVVPVGMRRTRSRQRWKTPYAPIGGYIKSSRRA